MTEVARSFASGTKTGGVERLNTYQAWTKTTSEYPEAGKGTLEGVIYTTLGLNGEAGEVANKLKKVLRDNKGKLTGDMKYEMAKELGDVLWYLARCADELGYSLSDIAMWNIDKINDRQERGKVGGSGDNR